MSSQWRQVFSRRGTSDFVVATQLVGELQGVV